MDRMLYVAMSGAKETLKAQTANNHNLANASTTGFRADLAAFQSQSVKGAGYGTRAYAMNSSVGFDATSGAMQSTGRDLDVAIQGRGYIAVQGRDGREAYTRAGNLRVDPTGQLMTATGLQVMGDAGPISVPPNASLLVGTDGTISIVPMGQGPETRSVVGRIKLVDPPTSQMVRSDAGVFRDIHSAHAARQRGVDIGAGSDKQPNVLFT